MNDHFDQAPRRSADFIRPPNALKNKVGSGGLTDDILHKAQDLLQNNTMDFAPLAETYLGSLSESIEKARAYIGFAASHEIAIVSMLYPTMQLKANGGMFHYPVITQMSDKLVQFLEVIETIDADVIDLVLAFKTSVRAVLASKLTDENDPRGHELLFALDDACRRYFSKHPNNKNPI